MDLVRTDADARALERALSERRLAHDLLQQALDRLIEVDDAPARRAFQAARENLLTWELTVALYDRRSGQGRTRATSDAIRALQGARRELS